MPWTDNKRCYNTFGIDLKHLIKYFIVSWSS